MTHVPERDVITVFSAAGVYAVYLKLHCNLSVFLINDACIRKRGYNWVYSDRSRYIKYVHAVSAATMADNDKLSVFLRLVIGSHVIYLT